MSFTLDRAITNTLPIEQANYRPQLAQRAVAVELLRAAQSIDPKVARIDVSTQGEQIQWQITGRQQQQTDALHKRFQTLQQQAYNDYLFAHYYTRFVTPSGQEAIKPDHLRYINESTLALAPISQAIIDALPQKTNTRDYINQLLSWLQTIPYDDLQDRRTSNGSGFSPPLSVIKNNSGDCDSKSVLAAAIIRSFLPNQDMKLILLRDHALLAIALRPLATDRSMTINGLTYVLFEPTGPALLALGEISDTTEASLASTYYTIEDIP
jgi:hypothetical protein